MQSNNEITIQKADKGSKVVVMNTAQYIEALNNNQILKDFLIFTGKYKHDFININRACGG